MPDNWILQAIDHVRQDLGEEWAPPGTSCPDDRTLRAYFEDFSAGLRGTELSPHLQGVEEHAFACKECYLRLNTWLTEASLKAARSEAELLPEIEGDYSYPGPRLIEAVGREDLPRTLRLDLIGRISQLGGEPALVVLRHLAVSDADEIVRVTASAASDALDERVVSMQARLQARGRVMSNWTAVPLPGWQPRLEAVAAGTRASHVAGESTDGRLRWEVHREPTPGGLQELARLKIESEALDLEGARLLVSLWDGGDDESEAPRVEAELTLRRISERRVGAQYSLGLMRDLGLTEDSRIEIAVMRQ